MKPCIVYSPGYDISIPGLDWLHPFDGRKFSKAWDMLDTESNHTCSRHWLKPEQPIADSDLLRVHTRRYLDSLSSSAVVAEALEARWLAMLPSKLVSSRVVTPMRIASEGTRLATHCALSENAIVMNMGGGFHHASRDRGQGFCLYADVAVAIASMRARGLLSLNDPIAIIDLDAHRGNGTWDLCGTDAAVQMLDLYNFQVYPGLFPGDVEQFPFQVPLKSGTNDQGYLDTLREELPAFFRAIPHPRLAFYNAGTDILAGDPVGRLSVSAHGVEQRDSMVLQSLREREIPTVITTSGGYTGLSSRLMARLALQVLALR